MASSRPLAALLLVLLVPCTTTTAFVFPGLVVNVRQRCRLRCAHPVERHSARAAQLATIATESLPDDLDEWEWIDDDEEDDNITETTDIETASSELLSIADDYDSDSDYKNELEAALDLSNAAAARVSAPIFDQLHIKLVPAVIDCSMRLNA
jgi:hypothetical protein